MVFTGIMATHHPFSIRYIYQIFCNVSHIHMCMYSIWTWYVSSHWLPPKIWCLNERADNISGSCKPVFAGDASLKSNCGYLNSPCSLISPIFVTSIPCFRKKRVNLPACAGPWENDQGLPSILARNGWRYQELRDGGNICNNGLPCLGLSQRGIPMIAS